MKKQLTPKQQSARDKALNNKNNARPMNSKGQRAPPLPPRNHPMETRSQVKNNNNNARSKQPTFFANVGGSGGNPALKEIITFDEFVADINGSVAFTATGFPLQPGIVKSFPKGSIKAALYSEWSMNNCEFYYKPEVSGFATQGQSGKVILAMDYNAGNPAPTTKQEVEVMHHSDDMPYEKIHLRLDPRSVNRSDAKYIRTGPIPVDEDIKTFDGGNLWICSIGQTNASLIGELRVRYSFLCTKPTLLNPAQGGLIPNTTNSLFQSTTAQSSATTVSANLAAATATNNGLAIVNTAGSFVPPSGNYLVDATLNTTSTGDFVVTSFDCKKNGTSVYVTVPINESSQNIGGTASYGYQTTSLYVSCNGTDAITFPVIQTFGAGSVTYTGTVRFQAV